MPDHGFTVSPSITINDDGSETLNYNDAIVESDQHRIEQIEEFTHNQDEAFFEHNQRGIVNRFSEIDFEALEESIEEREEFEPIDLTPEDIEFLQNGVGGSEQYQDLMEWAASHLPADMIDAYDHLMDTGDVEEIQEYVQSLYQHYLDNGGPGFVPQERTPQGVDEAFVNEVHRTYGDQYQNLLVWAQSNLSPEQIAHYDNIMEVGDNQDVLESIHNLFKYQQQVSN